MDKQSDSTQVCVHDSVAQKIFAESSTESGAKEVVVHESHDVNQLPGPCKVSQNVNQSDLNSIMKKIELETEQKMQQAPLGHWLSNPESLIGVMQNGADEFKAKTGRNMTYAEMRSLYG